jgi:hypothetical protein
MPENAVEGVVGQLQALSGDVQTTSVNPGYIYPQETQTIGRSWPSLLNDFNHKP